jgi:hypothetical protein
MTTPEQTSTPEATAAHRLSLLHQPWRVVFGLVELLLAAGLVVFAVWCWHQGVVRIVYTTTGSIEPAIGSRYLGSWIGAAIALCVLAGFLLLDALRELALGLRARPRRRKDPLLTDE